MVLFIWFCLVVSRVCDSPCRFGQATRAQPLSVVACRLLTRSRGGALLDLLDDLFPCGLRLRFLEHNLHALSGLRVDDDEIPRCLARMRVMEDDDILRNGRHHVETILHEKILGRIELLVLVELYVLHGACFMVHGAGNPRHACRNGQGTTHAHPENRMRCAGASATQS